MEIITIKGDTISLMYHTDEAAADVGQQVAILEVPDKKEGLVAQIISNDSLEYPGMMQEMIQKLLEQRLGEESEPVVNREVGMGEIKSLKIAAAKIRKRIKNGKWEPWDGWIPTRNVEISLISADELLSNILPKPEFPLKSFTKFNGTPIQIDGPRLDMVNVITGVKGAGKSHFSKHLVISLVEKKIPCIIFDINGEYVQIPNNEVLIWGENFRPNLIEVGPDVLLQMIENISPLKETSQAAFMYLLPRVIRNRLKELRSQGKPPIVDLKYLAEYEWSGNDLVQQSIVSRLHMVQNLHLFAEESEYGAKELHQSLNKVYEIACSGKPVIFDMRSIGSRLQGALVKAIIKVIERKCQEEINGSKRFPYVFFEEAHFYVNKETILNIITRGRHIGIASVFVTNSPQELPDTVFRQLDNLFLLSLTHKNDIKNTSQNSFTDEATIESFATRMKKHHALIMGNITNRYPLVVEVDALPDEVPTTGKTRSTWDRYKKSEG